MLSISQPMTGSGKGHYYLSLAKEDYYLEGGEPLGQWFGSGAQTFGIHGKTVEKAALRNLLLGKAPSDSTQGLVQNAGSQQRTSGWDLTFSAPKSVSVLWAHSKPEIRQAIQAAHEDAVKETIRYVEEVAGQTRRGHNGNVIEEAKLTFALFEHGTSRAQDPQLHTHALLMNVAVRDDGTTGAVWSKEIFRQKMTAGALYRAELSTRLQNSIGVEIDRDRDSFKIPGVPEALCETFSQRRKEIERELSESGLRGAVAAKLAALDTRSQKDFRPRDELFHEWQQIGAGKGFTAQAAEHLLSKARCPSKSVEQKELEKDALFNKAVGALTEGRSFFGQRDALRAMAVEAQGRGYQIAEIRSAVDRRLKTLSDLGMHRGERAFTTHEMMQTERALLASAERLADSNRFTVRSKSVTDQVKKSGLSQEQGRAVTHITQSAGDLKVVSGMAGTGKTRMLAAAHEVWRTSGYRVMGACLAGKAAAGLSSETGIQTQTIAALLRDIRGTNEKSTVPIHVRHTPIAPNAPRLSPLHGLTVPHLAVGWGKGKPVLDDKTVLVIDEAGMVGTGQMKEIMDAAEKARSKVVLVGDAKQLQAIEAGGPFAALQQRFGSTALTEIRRQNEQWARDAVKEISDGEAEKVLDRYSDAGLLTTSKRREASKDALVSDWSSDVGSEPKRGIILVATNEDAYDLNRRVQRARIKMNSGLGGDSVKVGREFVYENDRVVFTKNDSKLGVYNGTYGTVTKVSWNRISVQIDGSPKDKTVEVRLRQYDNLRLGYAVTVHKAQGMTAERAYVLLGGSMQDRELSYVQLSRAKAHTRVYADIESGGEKLQTLLPAMARSHQKQLAVDVLERRQVQETRTAGGSTSHEHQLALNR